MSSWWSQNRDNVGAIAALVSAVGVLLWILVTLMTQRQIQTTLAAQAQSLAALKRGDKDIEEMSASMKLLEQVQCLSPNVMQNTRLASALGCTAQVRAPPSAQVKQVVSPTVHEGLHLPNYGYFGPFGTATMSDVSAGMPAFYP